MPYSLHRKRAMWMPPCTMSSGLPGHAELCFYPGSDEEDQADMDRTSDHDDNAIRRSETQMEAQPHVTQVTTEVLPSRPAPARPAHTNSYSPGTVDRQSTRVASSVPAERVNQRGRSCKRPAPSQATSRLHAEKLADMNSHQQQMTEAKHKRRTQELADRREAREVALQQALEGVRLQHKYEDRKARFEHEYQLALIEAQGTTSLLTALIMSNRSLEEIRPLLTLIPGIPISQRAPRAAATPAPPGYHSTLTNLRHQLSLMQTTPLLTALVKSNRSIEEMRALLTLVQGTPTSQQAPPEPPAPASPENFRTGTNPQRVDSA